MNLNFPSVHFRQRYSQTGKNSGKISHQIQQSNSITISLLINLYHAWMKMKRRNDGKEVKMRSLIGSRPPRCESICRNCGHCEAVQVPIDDPSESDPKHPQTRTHQFNAVPKVVAYSRGDGIDNYKPMSWKCKCGNHIFNPWPTVKKIKPSKCYLSFFFFFVPSVSNILIERRIHVQIGRFGCGQYWCGVIVFVFGAFDVYIPFFSYSICYSMVI